MAKKSENPRVHTVPLRMLVFDPRVNRPLLQSWVDTLTGRFVRNGPPSFLTCVASERSDGSFVMLDGQHRIAAYRQAYPQHENHQLKMVVWSGLTVAEEAAEFIRLNTTRTIHSLHKYLIGVESQDPRLLAIDAAVNRAGFKVVAGGGDGSLVAVSALAYIYDHHGERHLEHVLTLTSAAWGHTREAVQATILRGISLVLARFGTRIDESAFVKKLSKFPGGANGVVSKARGSRDLYGGNTIETAARIMIGTYNKGRRSGVLDW